MDKIYSVRLDTNDVKIDEHSVLKRWVNKRGVSWIEIAGRGVISGSRMCRENELFFNNYEEAVKFCSNFIKKKIVSNEQKITALQEINTKLVEQLEKFGVEVEE